jgi:putative ferrous iron transport protein C
MLMDIKSYLAGRGPASLSEIAARLSADPEAVRPMLDYWIRKKRIRRVGSAPRCHGCISCAAADLEFYEWAPAPSTGADPEGG